MRFRLFEFWSASLSIDGRLQILSSVFPSCYYFFCIYRDTASYSCSSIGTSCKISSVVVSRVISGIVVASRSFNFDFFLRIFVYEYWQETMPLFCVCTMTHWILFLTFTKNAAVLGLNMVVVERIHLEWHLLFQTSCGRSMSLKHRFLSVCGS